jgi:hypothetical protein
VRVVQTAQNGDFGHEVVFELLVQLTHVDRLDGDRLALFLGLLGLVEQLKEDGTIHVQCVCRGTPRRSCPCQCGAGA